jgi:hypothetical protein
MVKIPSSTRGSGVVVTGGVACGPAESELHPAAAVTNPPTISDTIQMNGDRGMGGL